MKALKYFLFSVVCVGTAVVFVIFSWQNDRQVQLCFYKYCTREGLLSGFILVSFFLGMLFAGFFCAFPLLKNKATTMALKKQMKKYENEIQMLRNQPIDDLPQNRSVEVAKLVEKEETVPPHFLQAP